MILRNDTDWRQQSAMESNQSNGRGWAFDPADQQPSLRPHFLIAVAAVVIIGLALIASIH